MEAKGHEGRRPILWATLCGGGVFAFCFGLGMMVVGDEARAGWVGGCWGAIVFFLVLSRRLERKRAPIIERGRPGVLGYVIAVGLFLLLWFAFLASLG